MCDRYCQGCGATLQTTEPNRFGFVPDHLLEQDALLCQRCFRINHYGQDEIGPVQASDAFKSISAGVDWSDGMCLVVDLLDFEAGLPPALLGLMRGKNVVLAVNKVDLIPKTTPPNEVRSWVKSRLGYYGLPRVKVVLISAVNGYGFPALADHLLTLGKKILFVGITNVGKSSVLQRLLQMRIGGGQRKKTEPTISPYPGTTVNVSRWSCPGGLVLADSPGFVPQGRISDLVSPELAQEIIPHRSLSSHLYPVKSGDAVVIKGLCAVECISEVDHGLLLGFTGSGVNWQKTSSKQLNKWLQKGVEGAPIKDWEEHLVQLEPSEDLCISGLGWVSARKSPQRLRLHIPVGAEFTIRPNLIGPKDKTR
ncbi:MAG: 50S ribosome-binding GTPase [Limnochordia bacterium]|nr:50S ribosome-binding GTPase [Limnochordia bacterium]